MDQNGKNVLSTLILIVVAVFVCNYLYSCNQNKIDLAVAETLQALPTGTRYPTRIPLPTYTSFPDTPTVVVPLRYDLAAHSLDYVVDELTKEGFKFTVYDSSNSDREKGNRIANGEYIYNNRESINLIEERYSLVSAGYSFDYSDLEGLDSKEDTIGSEVLMKIIVGEQAYKEKIELWYSGEPMQILHSVLCFEGYVFWLSSNSYETTTHIMLEQKYRELHSMNFSDKLCK